MRAIVSLMAICVGVSSAHAAEYRIDFIPDEYKLSRMDAGSEIIDSLMPPSVVRVVEPAMESDGKPIFFVAVLNRGSIPFNFGPENITLILNDRTTRLPMASFEQLVKEEKGRQRRRAIGLALGAFGRGMQASQEGQFSGTVNSNTGRQVGTFSGTETGSSRTAQMLAQQQTQSEAAEMQRRDAEGMAGLTSVLRTSTVDPGKVVGGEIRFDWPKSMRKDGTYPIVIEVQAGDATHYFGARVTKD